MVAWATSEKSQTLCPHFPCFTDNDDRQGVGVIPWKDNCTLRSESLFMASLTSPKKQQSRRILKRSNPLFFRWMTHGTSTESFLPCFPRIDKEKTPTRYLVVSRAACLFNEQRVLLRDFLGTRLQFPERMSEVASTTANCKFFYFVALPLFA